jgi:hypothetical protein
LGEFFGKMGAYFYQAPGRTGCQRRKTEWGEIVEREWGKMEWMSCVVERRWRTVAPRTKNGESGTACLNFCIAEMSMMKNYSQLLCLT